MRQVINPETVKELIPALEDVVSPRGTAKGAAVPGYSVGGKTGTAQKVSPAGRLHDGQIRRVFRGISAGRQPRTRGAWSCSTTPRPRKPNENFGGLVAAPVFASIAGQAMHYLNIEPTLPDHPRRGERPEASWRRTNTIDVRAQREAMQLKTPALKAWRRGPSAALRTWRSPSICYDSRQVKAGRFSWRCGASTSMDTIMSEQAVARGAAAVMVEHTVGGRFPTR